MKKGISIHIGLEYLDTAHYANNGALRTCGKDALDMQEIAQSRNFDSTKLLLNEEANREAVSNAILEASKELVAGDILFLSYSGHGGTIPDESSDEEDGKDETWCLFDGFFLDDELHALWTAFEEDVRIFVVSDSCHSGTITKAPPGVDPAQMIVSKYFPEELAKEVYLEHKDFYIAAKETAATLKDKEIKATVKLISGCQDDESSFVLPQHDNSLLTVELNRVWDSGQFLGSTADFFENIKEGVVAIAQKSKVVQQPNYYTIGKDNDAFDKQKPFGIYE